MPKFVEDRTQWSMTDQGIWGTFGKVLIHFYVYLSCSFPTPLFFFGLRIDKKLPGKFITKLIDKISIKNKSSYLFLIKRKISLFLRWDLFVSGYIYIYIYIYMFCSYHIFLLARDFYFSRYQEPLEYFGMFRVLCKLIWVNNIILVDYYYYYCTAQLPDVIGTLKDASDSRSLGCIANF